jgi:hypothetical protein
MTKEFRSDSGAPRRTGRFLTVDRTPVACRQADDFKLVASIRTGMAGEIHDRSGDQAVLGDVCKGLCCIGSLSDCGKKLALLDGIGQDVGGLVVRFLCFC